MTTAHAILSAAQSHMQDRAATYDKPEGERSMCATVEAFRAITGIRVTQEQGWLFMALLKAVRSQQGAYRADSYEDGAAYFALAGEAAARYRKKPVIRELYTAEHQQAILDGHEVDTDFDTEKTRMPQVGTNGNDGGHYAEVGDGWVAHYGGPQPVPDGTVVQFRMLDGARDEQPAGHLRWDWNGWPGDIMTYKILSTTEATDKSEWVANTGEVPNLPGDTEVQAIRRDGGLVTSQIHHLSWRRVGLPRDIVRYRIIEDR